MKETEGVAEKHWGRSVSGSGENGHRDATKSEKATLWLWSSTCVNRLAASGNAPIHRLYSVIRKVASTR